MSDSEGPRLDSVAKVTLPFRYDPGDGKAAVGIASICTQVPFDEIEVVSSEVKGSPPALQLAFMGRTATGVDNFPEIGASRSSTTELVS